MSFTPTNKQLEAIEKMETFCKIKSHRTNFESKKEFDDYFVRLQKRGNKVAKQYDAIASGKTSYAEINKRKQVQEKKYYSNYETLRKYAVEYINRYFPSIKQTEGKLIEKNSDYTMVNKVLNSVKHLIEEEKMIKNMVFQLRHRGKNINYISNKLYGKKFDGLLIKKALGKLSSEGTLLKEYSLEDKFNYYKNKGKSKFEIKRMFIERNEDKEVVEKTLEKVFGASGEQENLKELIENLKRENVDGKKIIQKLMRKGYSYPDITSILNA